MTHRFVLLKVKHNHTEILFYIFITPVKVTLLGLLDRKSTIVNFLFFSIKQYWHQTNRISACDDVDTVSTCDQQSKKLISCLAHWIQINLPSLSRNGTETPEKETLRSLKCGVSPEKYAHPRMANAGSSWRSNGKSRRKRVLKRAVMVSEEREDWCHRVEMSFCYRCRPLNGTGHQMFITILDHSVMHHVTHGGFQY